MGDRVATDTAEDGTAGATEPLEAADMLLGSLGEQRRRGRRAEGIYRCGPDRRYEPEWLELGKMFLDRIKKKNWNPNFFFMLKILKIWLDHGHANKENLLCCLFVIKSNWENYCSCCIPWMFWQEHPPAGTSHSELDGTVQVQRAQVDVGGCKNKLHLGTRD